MVPRITRAATSFAHSTLNPGAQIKRQLLQDIVLLLVVQGVEVAVVGPSN